MGSHHRKPRFRVPGSRGLLLSARDILILAVCALGIAAVWLAYGVGGAGGAEYGAGHPGTSQNTAAGTAAPSSSPPLRPAGTPPATAPAVVPAGATAAAKAAPSPASAVPAASAPRRITFPAAGMDVAVHPLVPADDGAESRSIVPPETMDGYWLEPYGSPGAGSTNTTYIIGHSWLDQDAPFNHLSTDAAPGDELTVATEKGVLRYAVESVTTFTKSTLKDSHVWDAVPNRLVLISCYTEDPWGKNVVVVASPVRGP